MNYDAPFPLSSSQNIVYFYHIQSIFLPGDALTPIMLGVLATPRVNISM